MAKNTSLFGKVSGKIGAVVFSTSGGETISREYNPHVANPNTQAQINQRARMKLMSQLSAALAPVIAMPKEGLVSKRNKFVKRNFTNSYALEGVAQVSYENVQLTEGSLALPQINGQANGTKMQLYFAVEPSANISRVIWCIFRKTDEQKLEYVTSSIVSERKPVEINEVYFPYTTDINLTDGKPADSYVIFAYGMIDAGDQATANYGNLAVENASDLAKLIATRAISFSDYQFTQTRGTTWQRGESGPSQVQANSVRIFVSSLGDGGTVTGGGTYVIGSEVTIEATPNTGYTFNGWLKNGTNQVVSMNNPYTFEAEEQLDLVASWGYQQGI